MLDQLQQGTVISTSQTLYVYAETATTPNCSSENSFDVTINYTPVADAPANVTACEFYILPSLTEGGYFTAPGGIGPIATGTSIDTTQTLYVYAETGLHLTVLVKTHLLYILIHVIVALISGAMVRII